MGLLDTQLAGVVTNSVSSSNVSLSYANIQCCMFRFTGTLLASIVASPAGGDAATYFNGFYYFENVTTGSFTITLTTGAGSVVLPQGRRGVLFVDSVNGPRIVAGGNGDVATGSKTIWYNTAAPSGWTAVAMNDYAIDIVTEGLGGVTAGSVAYSTLFARTATDNTTLTESTIPSHQHFGFNNANVNPSSTLTAANYPAYWKSVDSYAYQIQGTSTAATLGLTSATGGGNGHTHPIDMRVQTAAFTLCSRN